VGTLNEERTNFAYLRILPEISLEYDHDCVGSFHNSVAFLKLKGFPKLLFITIMVDS
jgi:hypothetical protein